MKFKKLIAISILVSIFVFRGTVTAFAEENVDTAEEIVEETIEETVEETVDETENKNDEEIREDYSTINDEDSTENDSNEDDSAEDNSTEDDSTEDDSTENDPEEQDSAEEDTELENNTEDEKNRLNSSISIRGFVPTLIVGNDGYLLEDYCLAYESSFNAYDELSINEAISILINSKNQFSKAEKSALRALDIADTCPPDLIIDVYYNQNETAAVKIEASYSVIDDDGNESKKHLSLYEKDIE